MPDFFNIHPYITSTILSLLLGAVIGLERETMIQRNGMQSVAGIRTFSFISLMGAVSGILGQLVSPLLTVAGFLSVVVLVAMGYIAEQKQNKIGLTTEITSLITFLTGVLVTYGQIFLGVIVTIAVMTILSQRQFLHKFAGKLESYELFASVKFAIIAFIVLPLLPDKTFDPWNALNPHQIWLIVVLISGLNFAGYILNKIFGEKKGMALTGFFGGFVSSTAVNLSLAEQSKSKKGSIHTSALLLALFLAQAASLLLTQLELFILNRGLFFKAVLPINTVIFILLAFAIYFYRSHEKTMQMDKTVNMKSPFTLSQALLFGGIFSAMMLSIKVLFAYIGNTGLYITALFSGLISLDAMTVTVAEITGNGGIAMEQGMTLLLLGIIMSIVQKIAALMLFAERKFKLLGISFLAVTMTVFGVFAYLG